MARYREIADDLRQRIQSGEFPVGSKLPPIGALQEAYGVPGLNTIRTAQQVLAEEGMVESRQGIGVFVVSARSLRQLDTVAELGRARDTLTTVLAALQAPTHSVTFDLTDSDLDFVLTEALREFAARERDQADTDPASAGSRRRWADVADAALGRIENPQPGSQEGPDL